MKHIVPKISKIFVDFRNLEPENHLKTLLIVCVMKVLKYSISKYYLLPFHEIRNPIFYHNVSIT